MATAEERASWRKSVRTSVEKIDDQGAETGSGAITVISLLTGLGGTAVIICAWVTKQDDFYWFARYVLTLLEQPDRMLQVAFGTYAAGLALFLSSFFLSVSSLLQKRKATIAGLVMVLISAIMVIIGGGVVLDAISSLDSTANSPSIDTADQEASRDLQDFSVALYDTCCVQPGFVDNAPAVDDFEQLVGPADDERWSELPVCEDWFAPDCVRNRLADDCYTELDDLRRFTETCVGSYSSVQWFELAVIPELCEVINSTTVDIDAVKLGDFELSQLTRGVSELVIAGEASRPTYGCGGGKIRSFQLVNYIWFLNIARPIGIVLITVGVLSVLLAFFGFASLGLSSGNDMELNMAVINAYMDQQEAQHFQQAARVSVERPARPVSVRAESTGDVVNVALPVDVDDKI